MQMHRRMEPWTDAEIIAELRAAAWPSMTMPRPTELRQAGRRDLMGIMDRRGGWRKWAERARLPILGRKPFNRSRQAPEAVAFALAFAAAFVDVYPARDVELLLVWVAVVMSRARTSSPMTAIAKLLGLTPSAVKRAYERFESLLATGDTFAIESFARLCRCITVLDEHKDKVA